MSRPVSHRIRHHGLDPTLAAMVLAALALALPTTRVHAQVAPPTPAVQEVDAKAPPSLADQLRQAQAQLAQARQTRDQFASGGAGESQASPATNKERLLDWLVDLQGEKVKRLEDLVALQDSSKVGVDDDPLVKALEGQPPYSALKIDALRDEIDGLKENLAAAEASARANQTELQNLQDQLKARAAAVRLAAGDALGQAAQAKPIAQEDAQPAALLRRAAEVEFEITTLDQESLRLRAAALTARIQDLTAVVARALPEQRLSPDDLAAQRRRVGAEQTRLAAEAAEAGKRYLRDSGQRDRLAGEHRQGDEEAGKQTAYLNLAVKTDNAILKGLDDLQILNGLSGDSWERRYAVLSSADAEQRRGALAALRELRRKLADWRNLSHTRQEALRTEIREQRMRIGNLAPGAGGEDLEARHLSLLLQQATIAERVELAATRLDRQVSRWLADVDAAADNSFDGRLVRLRDRAVEFLTKVWQQELFVAEDVSEVDGHRVSVQYGVTVGKSIGVVSLLVFGYWLLSRLARMIQSLLVRFFKVSSQLASVVRRWSVIALTFALVVVALNLARIPLSVFAFLGGALAIGVGFGAQTVIKNFISGLIVLFERKVRIGDIVELGGVTGHVTAVDLRATTVRSFNGVETLIPNANFVENQVVNWTYSNRYIRHELRVGLAYGSDVSQVESLFLAAANGHANVLKDPAPEVFFEDFGDSALTVVLVYWVELDNPVGPRRIASDLRHDIYRRLAEAGIEIPFPQRDVRISLAHPLPVRMTNERPWETVNGK